MIDRISQDLEELVDDINKKKNWNLEYKNLIPYLQCKDFKNTTIYNDEINNLLNKNLANYIIDNRLKEFFNYIKKKWNLKYNNYEEYIKFTNISNVNTNLYNIQKSKYKKNSKIKKIDMDLEIFLDYINIKKNWNLDYKNFIPNIQLKDKINTRRCIGRLWDEPLKKSYNYEDLIIRFKKYNINKQCKNYAVRNDMCESCNTRKASWGRVDEYPSLLIELYNNLIKTRLIKDYNNLDKSKYTEEEFKNLSQVCKRNANIELDLNNFKLYKKNKNYIKKISNNQSKDMLELNLNKDKEIYNNTEINNNIEIKNNIELYKTDIYQEWWDSELTDKIKIYDNNSTSSFIFAMEETNEGKFLLNKNQQILGEYREWEDKNNEILECFKNNDNKIIHPESVVPLLEFEIFKESSLYHNITCKIYREFRYNKNKESMVNTNCIEIL